MRVTDKSETFVFLVPLQPEPYSSFMDSGTSLNSTRAHKARVLNGQIFYFLIKLSMSSYHVGLKNMVLVLTKLEYHKKW